MHLSLSRAWDESREIFARDGGLFSAVALALLVLPELVAGLVAPSSVESAGLGGRIIALTAAFIGVIGQLAIVRLALGPSTTVGEAIRHGARRFPPTLGALIILMFGIAIVVIPLIAILMAAGVVEMPTDPGVPSASVGKLALVLVVLSLFVAVKFIVTVPVASAEQVGPWGIVKRSWTLTRGRYWPLFALELLLLAAALALLIAAQFVGGSLAQLIGGDPHPFSLSALILSIFVAVAQAVFTVLASIMLARIYAQLAGGGDAEVSVPSSGT